METERLIPPCYINAVGIVCALGDGVGAVKQQLEAASSNFTVTDQFSPGRSLPLGLCQLQDGESTEWPDGWTRNNQIALRLIEQIEFQVQQAIGSYGAHRVGVVLGTSTSSMAESEQSIRSWQEHQQLPQNYSYRFQEMGGAASFVATALGVSGPSYGISTACSSGAKALASARRLIRAGVCDAVIAGGIDTLCQLTVQGFASLEAVSERPCLPFSRNRNGITIGEGGALFLLSKEPAEVRLSGVGESSDAHHISAPDPSGQGAVRCMTKAVEDAALAPDVIDYINLHGTATQLNDQMEAKAVAEVFGLSTRCGSTKGFTGHTLGAAGAIETAICWMLLQDNTMPCPPHSWDNLPDETLPRLNFVTSEIAPSQPIRHVLTNSFAFGGNNISLVLSRSN